MLYTTLNVNGIDYKLRLNTKNCIELEKRFGTNPVNILVKLNGEELPSLENLIIILQASLQALEHGFTIEKTYALYDDYVNEGHTMIELIPVIIEVFKVSGLIPDVDEASEVGEKIAP